jgi:hypothetical protein
MGEREAGEHRGGGQSRAEGGNEVSHGQYFLGFTVILQETGRIPMDVVWAWLGIAAGMHRWAKSD